MLNTTGMAARVDIRRVGALLRFSGALLVHNFCRWSDEILSASSIAAIRYTESTCEPKSIANG
jgi:hypothetical protein